MPALPPQGIFISYRHADTGAYARLLQAELGQRFPDARIFMDLDSIEAGLDFADVLREAVNSCLVMLALIGPRWLTVADEEGRCRLDDPDDYVRFEVRTALKRGVRVIPVLLDGAKPLRHEQLPACLRKLARLNALEMSYDRYQYDVQRLADTIERILAKQVGPTDPGGPATTSTPEGLRGRRRQVPPAQSGREGCGIQPRPRAVLP